ncbi:UNVERIFIED_CONTAM: stage III sporulation protein AE [Acetivibrio alkalicellulosi]
MKNKRCLVLLKTVFLITILFCTFNISQVKAEDEHIRNTIIEEQSQTGEIRSIKDNLQRYKHKDIEEIIPGYNPQNIISDVAKGKFEFNIMGILNGILMFLFKEIYLNIYILVRLMVLVVLCALLKNLQSTYLSKNVGELAFYVCYIALVSILLVGFNTAVSAGREIIDTMVHFMYACIPVLIALLISTGNITTGGVLQPLLIMIVQTFATIIKNILIPLLMLSTIISVVDNISEKIQVARLAAFLKTITTWSLGFILTIFIAIVAIQGSLGAVVDGVTSKTAKFAIGLFIPVAGKYLADAADTVIGCTLLIKNAVGASIMIGIIVICLLPILKMLAIVILYKITAILLEPIAEARIIKCINNVADSMAVLLGIIASVAFMFLITITALITAGNLSAMVR